MMRAARGLIHKSAHILSLDPETHNRVVSDLRRYHGNRQPCSDEVVRIEALLSGVPVDQCLTKAERRRWAREEERRRHDETWRRIDESKNAYEEWCRTFGHDPRTGRPGAERRIEGNVVSGPWDTAS